MPGGGQGAWWAVDVVQRFGLVAFLCGVISRGGRGPGREQPALPRSAGRWRCPGDMMIDWVSPPAGMRPLSLIRPSAWPCAGRAAADSGSAGAGRGGPHRVSSAAYVDRPGRRSRAGHVSWSEGSQAADSASSPSSARMWRACRRILRASDSAARLPLLAVLDLGVVAVVGGRGPGVGLAGLVDGPAHFLCGVTVFSFLLSLLLLSGVFALCSVVLRH